MTVKSSNLWSPRRAGSCPCLPAAAVVAALLALWTPVSAKAQGGTATLGEVSLFGEEEFTIQAATKTEQPLSKVPGSVSVVSARQIRESGSRTIPELLRLVAGVDVRWNPMVQTIDIRGFGQNPFTSRVLLLIDGVPYNSWNKGGFPQHPGFDFFMLQNIKRVEIVRGPGSSLYGENAYWGVINIVTLSGEDLEGGKLELYSGDLLSRSLGLTYGKSLGNGSILISGRLFSGQLPPNFWAEDADSEVEGSDVYIKGNFETRVGDVELSYYRHEDDLEGFDSPGFIPGSRFASAPEISQEVDILALKFSHEWSPDLSFSGDVSYAQRSGSRCSSCHAAGQNSDFTGTIDHGSQWIGDFRLAFKAGEAHNLLVGVEARRVDTGDHTDELLSPAAAAASGSELVFDYSKVAVYVQDQISLVDDRLQLILGARYDGDNDLFDSEVSPRIALVYNPGERTVLRGGYSTAFRFPNFSELYQDAAFLGLQFGPVFNTIQDFQPNPGLQPEEIRTFDLGLEHRFNPEFSAKLDLFRSEVRNFIVLSFQGGGPTRLQSVNHPDDAELRGGELELRWRPSDQFTALVNWSYQEADRDTGALGPDGRPIEFVYAPENKLNLAAYFGPFNGFSGALEAHWRDERLGPSFWNFASGGRAPAVLEAYTLVNLRLSWDLPISLGRAARGLRLSVYGKNLLDEEIRETFLPIDMQLPGSTFYGSVEVQF